MSQEEQADLHIHSTASDGTRMPEEIVAEAAEAGLAAVAIADHDTVDGILPAMRTGERLGVRVVPAVEINTDYGTDEVHILGYFIDYESETLKLVLDRQRTERFHRARKMVERLNELGVPVAIERIVEISGAGAIGRPHVARAIVETGRATSMSDAFAKYLVRGAAAYVERHKLTPEEAIGIIREAGGVAVLAHPKHEQLIPQLVEAGLQGIEVYHTDHSPEQSRRLLSLANRYGLIATGGSDSHGPFNLKTVEVGSVTVDMSVVRRLEELSSRKSGVM